MSNYGKRLDPRSVRLSPANLAAILDVAARDQGERYIRFEPAPCKVYTSEECRALEKELLCQRS